MTTIPAELKCSRHPTYKGVNPPAHFKTPQECSQCRAIYEWTHPDEWDPVGLKMAIALCRQYGRGAVTMMKLVNKALLDKQRHNGTRARTTARSPLVSAPPRGR